MSNARTDREAFEKSLGELHPSWTFDDDGTGGYHNPRTKAAWQGWQARGQAEPLTEPAFDFAAHLGRQAEWSRRTFGPGGRVEGVTDHIAKELIEVRESAGSLAEWVDVVILALDGCWRSGASPQQIIGAIVAKQAKNEGRKWPDWRSVPAGKAIEHDRSLDAEAPEPNEQKPGIEREITTPTGEAS
jgi:hypothetical protein